MKTFTVVTGGDYSAQQIADYMRRMRDNDLTYMRVTDKVYCAVGSDVYTHLDGMMQEQGFEFIGCDGSVQSMRCYYKDGKALWVRIEYDINRVWCLWNFGSAFDYNLETDGYKTMQ